MRMRRRYTQCTRNHKGSKNILHKNCKLRFESLNPQGIVCISHNNLKKGSGACKNCMFLTWHKQHVTSRSSADLPRDSHAKKKTLDFIPQVPALRDATRRPSRKSRRTRGKTPLFPGRPEDTSSAHRITRSKSSRRSLYGLIRD